MSTSTSPATGERTSWLKLAGVVAGIAAVLTVMLLAFLLPSINSGAHDLPLAVSGPAPAVQQLTTALDKQSPGAFDVTTHPNAAAVSDAVTHREAIGGISLAADGTTIVTAGGAGTPYATLLKNVGTALQQQGQHVTVHDVAPLTRDDPQAAGISALGLPLVFGGMSTAVLLATLFKRSTLKRVIGASAISIVGGLIVTAILQFGSHSIDDNYWLTALALMLGIAAICFTITGLESLIGFAGLGIGAVIMLFLANPLSGLATGPQWLPAPWGAIGQLLPVGAAGSAVRSAAFFGGSAIGAHLLVLACWVVLGAVLILLASRRTRAAARASA